MRVRMRVCMIVRTPPDTRPGPGPGPGHTTGTHHRTHDQDQDQDQDSTGTRHTTGTHDHRRRPGEHQRRAGRKATNKINFALYIGTIADDEKKVQKKLRKIWKCKKPAVSL